MPSIVGITEGDETGASFIDIVTADYFSPSASRVALGRPFTDGGGAAARGRAGHDPERRAWQRMGGRRTFSGGRCGINQRDFTIVGVAPKGFGGHDGVVTPELWLPTGVYETISNDFVRDGPRRRRLRIGIITTCYVVGRLRDGLAGPSGVTRPLEAASRRLEAACPVENRNQTLLVRARSRGCRSARHPTTAMGRSA